MTLSSPTATGLRLPPWARCLALAGLSLLTRSIPSCAGLEVLDSVVDRDGGVLVVKDILEGFGRVPVSVVFSPTTTHMFIGFKAGGVRIYPDGGDTQVATNYDDCVDMEDEVRQTSLFALALTSVRVLKRLHSDRTNLKKIALAGFSLAKRKKRHPSGVSLL